MVMVVVCVVLILLKWWLKTNLPTHQENSGSLGVQLPFGSTSIKVDEVVKKMDGYNDDSFNNMDHTCVDSNHMGMAIYHYVFIFICWVTDLFYYIIIYVSLLLCIHITSVNTNRNKYRINMG